MRKVTFGGANSLDNYLARPDHAVDWLLWGKEAAAVMRDYWKTIDTILMGRKTYEVALRNSQGKEGYPGVKTYVFSRTLQPRDHPGVTVVADKVEETVAALRAKSGKDIWLFGGASLFRSLLDARLVDTVEVAVMPVLLGGGIPLLPLPAKQAKLRLIGHSASKAGIVSLEYAMT